MTPNHDPAENRMIGLAKELEKQIESGVFAPTDSIDELADSDRDELARFEGALAYLSQIRGQIDNRGDIQNDRASPARAGSQDSTLGDFGKTLTDHDEPLSGHSKHPAKLGRFEIVRVLGQGGFARVFLARDPLLDRHIALKVPKPSALVSEESRARFDREARASAVLNHPHIVPVFETGSIGAVDFIASAYCPGDTLENWFNARDRDIHPKTAAAIVRNLADATEHAHQRGVIHRDLKPGNVMIDHEGSNQPIADSKIADATRITDFGLAKYTSGNDSFSTTDNAIIGTPAFMSPEQARGDRNISAASDIYSLGTMLYQLLAGQPPLLRSNHVQTLQAIQNDDPTPLRKIKPAVPKDLEAICLKSLQKDPASRYASAFALQHDLQNWLDGRPVNARPITRIHNVKRWCSRNPALAIALGLLFASLTAGMSLSLWFWSESQANLAIASAGQDRAKKSLYMAQDTIDQLINTLVTDPLIEKETRETLIVRSVELQEKLLEEDPFDRRILLATAKAYRQLALLYYDLAEYKKTQLAIDRGLELALQFSLLDGATYELVELFELDQTKITAVDHPENVDTVAPDSVSKDPIIASQQHHLASISLRRQGEYDDAMIELDEGLECLEDIAEDNLFGLDMKGRLLMDIGVVFDLAGNHGLAKQPLENSLVIFESMGDLMGSHPMVNEHLALCHFNLGENCYARKQRDAAIDHLTQCQSFYLALHRSDRNNSRLGNQLLASTGVLANVYLDNQNIKKAIEARTFIRESASKFKPKLQDSIPIQSKTIDNCLALAALHRLDGNDRECQTHLDLAAELLDQYPEIDPEKSAEYRQRLSELTRNHS